MIHSDLEIHNVAELQELKGGGVKLQRFPEAVRNALGGKGHSRGRFFAHRACGCEIRWVGPSKFFTLSLSSQETDAQAHVYCGDFFHSVHQLRAGTTTQLFVEVPPMFAEIDPGMLESGRFAPQVWRVLFNQDAQVAFHGFDAFGVAVRPPFESEKPSRRWLAYGSSITFGGNALQPASTYVQHAARLLGVDVFNKGLPGSCLCDDPMIEHLAALEGWDFATFELGVNMTELFSVEEFAQRSGRLLERAHRLNPEKMIFAMNLFPNRCDFPRDPRHPMKQKNQEFNAILGEIVQGMNTPQVHFIDGRKVLEDLSGLTTDLVHPSDFGHIRMGENLARLIQPHVFAMEGSRKDVPTS